MVTASIVQPSGVFQHNLFGNGKLVLCKFDKKAQEKEERTATYEEIERLRRTMRVREVHTHNDATLDALDVQKNLARVFEQLHPSADGHHRAPSTVEALEMAMMTRLELDDLIDVLCAKLEQEKVNWRELSCMQETASPTVYESF